MLKHALVIILLLIGAGASEASANDILFDSLQWRARVLVITGDRTDRFVPEQIALMRESSSELNTRDIAVIRFEGDSIYEMTEFSDYSYRGRYDMDADLQSYYEDEMQSDNNAFSLALFGKDGTFKKVWRNREDSVPLAEVFEEIDAMPMRQREMKDDN